MDWSRKARVPCAAGRSAADPGARDRRLGRRTDRLQTDSIQLAAVPRARAMPCAIVMGRPRPARTTQQASTPRKVAAPTVKDVVRTSAWRSRFKAVTTPASTASTRKAQDEIKVPKCSIADQRLAAELAPPRLAADPSLRSTQPA